MKTFTDTAGRTWAISLNLGTAMAVKDSLGIDLLQPEAGDPPLLTRLGTDELLLGEVICCLLAGQFEARARAVETQAKMIEAAVKAIETRIAGIDVDETIRGAMSGSSPEPSESNPGR